MGLIPMCVSSNYTTHIHHTTYTHNHVEREKKGEKREEEKKRKKKEKKGKKNKKKESLKNQITKSREAIESFNKLKEVRIYLCIYRLYV